MNNGQKITADQIKDLLGAPPLVKGESEEEYRNWWSIFVEAHQPESLRDWLELDELARKHWEQNRLRRSNSALIDGVLVSALKNLLRPFQSARLFMPIVERLSVLESHATKIANDYYFGSEEAKQRAREQVATWGITEDQIVAEATQMRGKALIMLDRLDGYRTSAKRALQKELDRRSQARRRSPPDQPESLQ